MLLDRCVERAHQRPRSVAHHSCQVSVCLGNHPPEEQGVARTGWWLQLFQDAEIIRFCRCKSQYSQLAPSFLEQNRLRKRQMIHPIELDDAERRSGPSIRSV